MFTAESSVVLYYEGAAVIPHGCSMNGYGA